MNRNVNEAEKISVVVAMAPWIIPIVYLFGIITSRESCSLFYFDRTNVPAHFFMMQISHSTFRYIERYIF